jgi:dynactin complex subunit
LYSQILYKIGTFKGNFYSDMLSNEQVQQLISENELLQIQLKDVNEMIEVREEELDLLRKTANHARELQSRLDANLYQIEQMQNRIGEDQRLAAGAARRESAMEIEMIGTLKMETEYYELKDQFASTKAALQDINREVSETKGLYARLAQLTTRVAELESNLEIAALDNSFLKEELERNRKEIEEAQQKKA